MLISFNQIQNLIVNLLRLQVAILVYHPVRQNRIRIYRLLITAFKQLTSLTSYDPIQLVINLFKKISQQMGNQQQLHYSVLQMPDASKWKESGKTDHCVLLKNQETGEEAEVYRVGIPDDTVLRDQLEMYEYRKTNQTKLVKVLNVQKATSSGLCSGTNSYRVITERIPLRLGQVDNLQLPEALHVLKECLDGFELIYPSIERPIEITKDMIGFTPQGKVKVWVNTNFAVNLPDRESYIKSEAYHSNESEMPRRLFSLIEGQTPNKQLPEQLKQRIQNQQNNTLSFARMKVIIRNFCIDNQIPFLEKLNLFSTDSEEDRDLNEQKVTVIHQTRIQSTPPPQIQEVIRNNSIVKSLQRNHEIQQPVFVEEQQIMKDRSVPTSGMFNPLNFGQPPPQMVPHQLAYQVNFPINTTQVQQLRSEPPLQMYNHRPFEVVNNNPSPSFIGHPIQHPVRNFQEAITYEERPSINGQRVVAHNFPPSFPHVPMQVNPMQINPNQTIIRSNSIQRRNQFVPQSFIPPSQPTFERLNLSSNPIRLNPQSEMNFQSRKFQMRIPTGSQVQPHTIYPHNIISNPYLSKNLGGESSTTFENKRFEFVQNSQRNLSPMRNQAYLNPTRLQSPPASLASFQLNNTTPTKFDQTATSFKNGYEFSTTGKKHQQNSYLENSPDFNRSLFESPQREYAPQSSTRAYGDDLLKRMQQLTNNVRSTINQAELDSRGQNMIDNRINRTQNKMDIRNYGKQRIRTFN